jgi:hypothetical protein
MPRMSFTFPAPAGTTFAPDAFVGSIGKGFRVRTTAGCVIGVLISATVHDDGANASMLIDVGDAFDVEASPPSPGSFRAGFRQ